MSKVLIIDDESGICRALQSVVRRNGHEAACTATLAEGVAMAAKEPVDLVFLDVGLPDGNGLDKIGQISQSPSNPEIIIMTGAGDPDGAELAIRNGAWDYIQKPSSIKAMTLPLLRALEYRAKKARPQLPIRIDREGIVGSSPAMEQILDQLAQTIGSDASVLITGETGTGKELFAQAVHRNSFRRARKFVVVDCASLPETLVESMLFGHVKGAFTGADGPREGLVKQADGGTLFLDEIGEMPLPLQKAFLRVLETHRFRPIGGKEEVASDFRVISSTNRDLEEMVREGTFRKDLLFRLRSFHLRTPALRQRREDILELATFHINRLCKLYGHPAKGLAPDLIDALCAHDWPGNVRELVNLLDRCLAAARRETILFACHLPLDMRAHIARRNFPERGFKPASTAGGHKDGMPLPPLQSFREEAVEKAEISYLNALMGVTGGDITKACALSGVGRSRLYELLKKYAIGVN
jgi:two-component system NtrC family response regulator